MPRIKLDLIKALLASCGTGPSLDAPGIHPAPKRHCPLTFWRFVVPFNQNPANLNCSMPVIPS
jgi:hypothetical protein